MQKSKQIKPAPEADAPALVLSISEPFIFDPKGKAAAGDPVLIKRGQGFAVAQYDGERGYLGTIMETTIADEGTDEASPALITLHYALLGQAIAGILAHPRCPSVVASQLNELMNELGNAAGVLNDNNIQARVLLPAALKALTEAPATD